MVVCAYGVVCMCCCPHVLMYACADARMHVLLHMMSPVLLNGCVDGARMRYAPMPCPYALPCWCPYALLSYVCAAAICMRCHMYALRMRYVCATYAMPNHTAFVAYISTLPVCAAARMYVCGTACM